MPNLQKVIENKLMKEIYKLQLFNKVIMVKNFLTRFQFQFKILYQRKVNQIEFKIYKRKFNQEVN